MDILPSFRRTGKMIFNFLITNKWNEVMDKNNIRSSFRPNIIHNEFDKHSNDIYKGQ